MTSILFLLESILDSQFRCNYLRKEKDFLHLFLHLWNQDEVLNIFKKSKTLIADVFPKLRTPKYVVKQTSKKSPFRGPFGNQQDKGTKHCWNLNNTTFTDHCEGNWVGKNIS